MILGPQSQVFCKSALSRRTWGYHPQSLPGTHGHSCANVLGFSKAQTGYYWEVLVQGWVIASPWICFSDLRATVPRAPISLDTLIPLGSVQLIRSLQSSPSSLGDALGHSEPGKSFLWPSFSPCYILTSISSATSAFCPAITPEAKKESGYIHAAGSGTERTEEGQAKHLNKLFVPHSTVQPIKETPLREPWGLGIKLATFAHTCTMVNRKFGTTARCAAQCSELAAAARQGAWFLSAHIWILSELA